MIKFIKEYYIIKKSGYFDPAFYLLNNPDVRKADVDALSHFITCGWKENRNPSAIFDITFYNEAYSDVRDKQINPLVHYILYGKKEGRSTNNSILSSETNNRLITNNKIDAINVFNNDEYIGKNSKKQNNYSKSIRNYFDKLVFYTRKARNIYQEEGWSSLISRSKRKLTNIEKTFRNQNEKGFTKENQLSQPLPNRVILEDELVNTLYKEFKNAKYIISISHDDYRNNVGGIQIRILDEQNKINSQGVDYLHLYPYISKSSLIIDNSLFFIGCSCNGKDIGVTNQEELLKSLKKIKTVRLIDIHIHHIMGFSILLLRQLLYELGNKKARLWVHDYYTICPSYCLLRNDVDYCGAPSIESNSCLICKYGDMRRLNRQELLKLFNDFDFDIFSPSEFTLSFWQEKFLPAGREGKVKKLATLSWEDRVQITKHSSSINIAYVGYPVHHKGWDAWLELTNSQMVDKRYKFIHFSMMGGKKGNYKRKSVSVTQNDRMAMVNTLQQNGIDVAFLWSIWPETFSFTLFESLASGCFIVTNKDSGNIQDYLKKNPDKGIVLDNLDELIELFNNGKIIELVENYQKNGIPHANLLLSNEEEIN